MFSLVVTNETQKEIFSARYHQLLLYDTNATLSFLHVWRLFSTIGINVTGDDTCKLEQGNLELLWYDLLLNFLPVLSIHEQRCAKLVYILWFLPVLATI
jgi:hypothetical protein